MRNYQQRDYITDEPKRYNWQKPLLTIVALLIAILLIVTSCNVYKPLAKHNPKSAADSTRLLTAAMKLLPPVQPPVTITHIDTLHDSTTIFKDRLKTIVVQNPDTCTDYFSQGESFGFNEGYDKGRSDCPPSTKEVDTVEVIPDYIRLQTQNLTTQISDLQKNNLILTTKNEVLTKDKNRFMWLFIALCVGGLTAITLWLKKKITSLPIPKL
jgi:hypothetical protein